MVFRDGNYDGDTTIALIRTTLLFDNHPNSLMCIAVCYDTKFKQTSTLKIC